MTTNPTGNDFKKAMLAKSNSNMARPLIRCGQLPNFDATDLASLRTAFAGVTPCALGQGWRAELEPEFAPAQVQVGWRESALMVFAELTDQDIYSAATGSNQRTWELGDTFEIFLRPDEQQEYFEFHVTPKNQRLQLKIPSSEALVRARATNDFKSLFLTDQPFLSATWVQPENNKWFVYAIIPALTVCRQARLSTGSRWLFSFSRYDYTRGNPEPVISSTSPHAVADFHRQQEWGELTFVNSVSEIT